MKCDEVTGKLQAYLDEELCASARADMHAHLESCSACSRSLVSLVERFEEDPAVASALAPLREYGPDGVSGPQTGNAREAAASGRVSKIGRFIVRNAGKLSAGTAAAATVLVALSIWAGPFPQGAEAVEHVFRKMETGPVGITSVKYLERELTPGERMNFNDEGSALTIVLPGGKLDRDVTETIFTSDGAVFRKRTKADGTIERASYVDSTRHWRYRRTEGMLEICHPELADSPRGQTSPFDGARYVARKKELYVFTDGGDAKVDGRLCRLLVFGDFTPQQKSRGLHSLLSDIRIWVDRSSWVVRREVSTFHNGRAIETRLVEQNVAYPAATFDPMGYATAKTKVIDYRSPAALADYYRGVRRIIVKDGEVLRAVMLGTLRALAAYNSTKAVRDNRGMQRSDIEVMRSLFPKKVRLPDLEIQADALSPVMLDFVMDLAKAQSADEAIAKAKATGAPGPWPMCKRGTLPEFSPRR